MIHRKYLYLNKKIVHSMGNLTSTPKTSVLVFIQFPENPLLRHASEKGQKLLDQFNKQSPPKNIQFSTFPLFLRAKDGRGSKFH